MQLGLVCVDGACSVSGFYSLERRAGLQWGLKLIKKVTGRRKI